MGEGNRVANLTSAWSLTGDLQWTCHPICRFFDGLVAALPRFLVSLDNGHSLVAYTAGKMHKHHIRIIAGGKLTLELSPCDLTRGASSSGRQIEGCATIAPRTKR